MGRLSMISKWGKCSSLENAFLADTSCKCLQGPSGIYHPQPVSHPSHTFHSLLTIPVTFYPIYSF